MIQFLRRMLWRVNLRAMFVLVFLAGFTAFAPRAMAGDNRATAAPYRFTVQGSMPTGRAQTDQYVASVYIYVGGSFAPGTHPATFQYLFGFAEFGNTTGYITPLLFESESAGEYTIYTVRGIGQGFEVALHSAPRTLPFDVIEGTKFTTNGHYTFGFVNALVDSSGTPTETSMGAVEFDNPADGGQGQGGASDNK